MIPRSIVFILLLIITIIIICNIPKCYKSVTIKKNSIQSNNASKESNDSPISKLAHAKGSNHALDAPVSSGISGISGPEGLNLASLLKEPILPNQAAIKSNFQNNLSGRSNVVICIFDGVNCQCRYRATCASSECNFQTLGGKTWTVDDRGIARDGLVNCYKWEKKNVNQCNGDHFVIFKDDNICAKSDSTPKDLPISDAIGDAQLPPLPTVPSIPTCTDITTNTDSSVLGHRCHNEIDIMMYLSLEKQHGTSYDFPFFNGQLEWAKNIATAANSDSQVVQVGIMSYAGHFGVYFDSTKPTSIKTDYKDDNELDFSNTQNPQTFRPYTENKRRSSNILPLPFKVQYPSYKPEWEKKYNDEYIYQDIRKSPTAQTQLIELFVHKGYNSGHAWLGYYKKSRKERHSDAFAIFIEQSDGEVCVSCLEKRVNNQCWAWKYSGKTEEVLDAIKTKFSLENIKNMIPQRVTTC